MVRHRIVHVDITYYRVPGTSYIGNIHVVGNIDNFGAADTLSALSIVS